MRRSKVYQYAMCGVGALLVSASMSAARAASCSAEGGLIFLGKTSDKANSLWLSGTSSGACRLDAAGTTKDTWSQTRGGLHLTLSDVVSPGNGGVHHLYDNSGSGCLLDSQNQRGGFNLPPIGKLFPDFLTPEIPVATKPPIWIVPPVGITPEIPVLRPPGIGITPEIPIIVAPPVDVLPPIGVLPPTGITPEIPVITPPPVGITPEVPIATRPPIGVLPPTGITPEIPVITPPPVGITPEVPVITSPDPEIPTVPPTISVPETVANAELSKRPEDFLSGDTCAILEGGGQLYRNEDGLVFTAPCTLVRQGGYQGITVASLLEQSDVPLTSGRQFVAEPLWNFWTETRGVYARDRRHNLDIEGYSGSVIAGFDRNFDNETVVGVSGSFESSGSDGYDGGLVNEAYGISVGPYFAHRLSREWAVQGSLGYMLRHNDLDVVVLEGDYFSHQLSAATALHGQYNYKDWTLRPRVGLSYAETFTEAYDLSGTVSNTPVKVDIGSDHFSFGEAEIAGEASTYVELEGNLLGIPYGELGLRYAFDRPNDGKILSGNLTLEETSDVTGTLRGGMRFIYDDRIYFDVGVGYLSLGQNGLDIWEAKARVSFAF